MLESTSSLGPEDRMALCGHSEQILQNNAYFIAAPYGFIANVNNDTRLIRTSVYYRIGIVDAAAVVAAKH